MKKNLGAKPYLFPQPVMIIASYDEHGKANAMNAAWGGIVGMDQIIISLGDHQTTDNIMINKAFTVSMADVEHVAACDYVGLVSKRNEPNKMEIAGFHVWIQRRITQVCRVVLCNACINFPFGQFAEHGMADQVMRRLILTMRMEKGKTICKMQRSFTEQFSFLRIFQHWRSVIGSFGKVTVKK